MAKNRNTFIKRQREMEKKQRAEDKHAKKQQRIAARAEETGPEGAKPAGSPLQTAD